MHQEMAAARRKRRHLIRLYLRPIITTVASVVQICHCRWCCRALMFVSVSTMSDGIIERRWVGEITSLSGTEEKLVTKSGGSKVDKSELWEKMTVGESAMQRRKKTERLAGGWGDGCSVWTQRETQCAGSFIRQPRHGWLESCLFEQLNLNANLWDAQT